MHNILDWCTDDNDRCISLYPSAGAIKTDLPDDVRRIPWNDKPLDPRLPYFPIPPTFDKEEDFNREIWRSVFYKDYENILSKSFLRYVDKDLGEDPLAPDTGGVQCGLQRAAPLSGRRHSSRWQRVRVAAPSLFASAETRPCFSSCRREAVSASFLS